jgi:hypothetical protein
MITERKQPISGRISMKTEIKRDHPASRARAPWPGPRTVLTVTAHHSVNGIASNAWFTSDQRAYEGARLTGLAMLSSLQRALGDLDRVTGWLRVFGIGVAELPLGLAIEIEAEVAVD